MKINNCFLMYSPFLHEHTISTECKKPETAIKRFTAVLCEVMAGCTERFDFGSLVRDTFNSSDSCSFDDGSFRKRFSCVDSGLMFDTTVSLTVTFHNGVYLLCIAFTSEDTSDTTEDTKDTTTICFGSFDDIQTDINICPEIFFENTKKDISNTDIDDTEKYTVCLGSLDGNDELPF